MANTIIVFRIQIPNLHKHSARFDSRHTSGHAEEYFRLRLTENFLTLAHLRTGRSGSIAIPEALRGSDEWRPLVAFDKPCKVSLISQISGWDFSIDDY